MKDKHRKTLSNVFKKPVQSGILWKDIESMLKAYHAEISEREDSRVRIKRNGIRATFHPPHPERK